MGRVTATIMLTNLDDLILRAHKMLKRAPRRMEVDVLVDTGATRIYLKPSVIKALGLRKTGHVDSRTTNGSRRRPVYSPIQLELMGRNGNFDVVGIDEDVPNLLGQITSRWTAPAERHFSSKDFA